MAVSKLKTVVSGAVISSSDWNAEFANIYDNGEDLAWPATKAKDFNGQELILDADGDTSISGGAGGDDAIIIKTGGVNRFNFTTTKFDVDGNQINLDSDDDTYIIADSDDLVRFVIGGTADVVQMDSTAVSQTNSNLLLNGDDVFAGPLLQSESSLSGTDDTFSSIPAWVKRITVPLNRVSTTGTSPVILQIGDSDGIETSGYNCSSARVANAGATVGDTATDGLLVSTTTLAASSVNGVITLVLLDPGSNLWMMTGQTVIQGNDQQDFGTCRKALSGTLDRVRLTTQGGSDTFDGGSWNIMYE